MNHQDHTSRRRRRGAVVAGLAAALILGGVAGPVAASSDATPPEITPSVTGAGGDGGWFTDDVTVSWYLSDPESPITSTTGCDTVVVTTDTPGTLFTCTASSAGGTSSQFAFVRRDATGPTVTLVADVAAGPTGAYDRPVTFTTVGDDGTGSGTDTCNADQTYSGPDAEAITLTGFCLDIAGNVGVGSITFDYVTAPPLDVTATPSRPADHAGWYDHPFTVTFVPTDPDANCTPPITYSGPDTGSASVSGSCTVGAVTQSATFDVRFDATAPSVTIAPARIPDHDGWYHAPVAFTTTGLDPASGLASCTGGQAYSGPSASGLTATGVCTDQAGNTGSATSTPYRYDAVLPTIGAVVTGTDGTNGWYTSAVSVDYTCADDFSGVADCSSDEILAVDGPAVAWAGAVADAAGNSASVSGTVAIDRSAPSVVTTVSPAPAASGWWNATTGAPTVTFTCSDATSGIASCPDTQVLGEGADQAASGVATDVAGNATSAGHSGLSVDLTAPGLTLTGGPADGATYDFGAVPAAPTCAAGDDGSGLAGPCTVDGYASAVGTHVVTASATDVAGNTTSVVRSFTVRPWRLVGFKGVSMTGLNNVRAGATESLSFEVFTTTGELKALSTVTGATVAVASCSTLAWGPETAATPNLPGGLSHKGGTFTYKWSTPKLKGSCVRITVTTADGSSLRTAYKLK